MNILPDKYLKQFLSGLVLHASLLHLLLEHAALDFRGFLEGVTVEPERANRASTEGFWGYGRMKFGAVASP